MRCQLAGTIAFVAALASAVAPAQAQDQLKLAIGQINNWENQAPTLGQDCRHLQEARSGAG